MKNLIGRNATSNLAIQRKALPKMLLKLYWERRYYLASVFKSNWLVANCRYDVLLGMPWHVTFNPSIDYQKRMVSVENDSLPNAVAKEETEMKITNLSAKKFKNMSQDESRN